MSQLDTSRYARSILSNSTRRDVLWNVSQPGDPYDIKKSMIAKLPGDRKVFMGEHLELVCLLQAAEIERLCEFLDDYRLKFREIERNDLDRHSYEVQIKELTEKVNGEDALRNENSKLKDFSKRLQGEIEFLQSSSRQTSYQDETTKLNYEKTLERLTLLTAENQQARRQLEDARYQLQTFAARFQALERAKNREIEDLKLNFSQFSKESYESALNALRVQGEAEVKRLQFQLKRMKELNEAKNGEISELQGRVRGLSEEVQRVGEREHYSYSLEGQVREYENKFVIFGTEIERLNIALRDYTNKLEESERRRRELDGKGDRLQHLNQDLQGRLRAKDLEIAHLNDILAKYEAETRRVGDSQQVVSQYESKLVLAGRENEALSSKLKYELESGKRLREEVERLTFESSKYRLLEKESASLKESVAENSALKKRLVELQNRSMVLSQELERLQFGLKAKDSQLEKYRSLAQENESLKSRFSQLEYTYTSRSELELTRIKGEYEQRLETLTRSQGTELQSRIQAYEGELERLRGEVERLRGALKARSEEFEQQRGRAYELEVAIKRAEVDTSARIKNYELAISNFKRENEDYYNRLKAAGESERRAVELQAKLTQYEREIERVTLNVKAREEEILGLRSKLRETEGVVQRYEFDVGKSKSGYEQSISTLRADNDALNRRLADLVNESNEKLKLAGQEIDRLGGLLRTKSEQRNQFEGKWKQTAQELDYLKQGLQKATAQNEQLKRRAGESEAKLTTLFNEGNASIRTLSSENDTLKKQLAEFKSQTNLYQFQVNKKVTIYEQNAAALARDNDDLKRRLNDYESRLALASQEIERLGAQLRAKNEEYNALKADSEKFRTAFKQYESDVNSHMELEVKRRFKEYEQKIQDLLAENEELKRRANDNANKFNLEFEKVTAALRQTTQENENLKNELKKQVAERREENVRFQSTVKQFSTDNDTLRRQFKEYQISVTQRFEGDVQPKMIAFQETIARLTKENEEVRRKLQEVGTDLSKKYSESEAKYTALGQEYSMLGQEYEKLRSTANGLAQENDVLKKKCESYEVSVSNYEGEVKRRFAAYEQTNAALNKENEELRRRLQELSEVNRKLAEYESRLALLSQELERLTAALKAAGQENEALRRQLNEKQVLVSNYELEVSRKVTTYESNFSFLQKENEDLKKRLTDSDLRLKNLNAEFQKLSNAYKLKGEEYSRLEVSIKNYENEVRKTFSTNDQNLNNLVRENEELKKRVAELANAERRAQDLENRVALASQQLERLTLALKGKQEEILKLEVLSRNQANQLQSWRKRYGQLEAKFSNTYEFEVKKKYSSYEQTISEFNRRNTETQGKLNNAIQEIERLNNILRLKVDESSQQAIQLKTLTNEYEDFKRKVRDNEGNYTQNAATLKRENEELRRRVQEGEAFASNLRLQGERRSGDLELRLKTAGQEVDRLSGLLKAKSDELEALRKQFKEYEFAVSQKFDGEVKTQFAQYETHLAALSKENEQYRRRLQEAGQLNRKLAEYENKIVLLSQETERLNVIIAGKIEENKKLTLQGEEWRRKLGETGEVARRIPEYEQRIAVIIQENEKLQFALRGKTDELGGLDLKFKQLLQENDALKKNIANLEYSWSSKHESEISRRTQTYEQTQSAFAREKEDLLRRLKQAEQKIALYGQEIERLTALLKGKTEENARLTGELESLGKKVQVRLQSTESEFSALQGNYNVVLKEYETAKRHLQEYQLSIRKLYTEFERLQGIINQLKKENQTLHNMNHNLSDEITRLSLQNKDLEQQASEVRLRLSDESALQKRINEHLALMVVLFAEIETLRNRVKDKEKEVAEVRRSSLAPNIL